VGLTCYELADGAVGCVGDVFFSRGCGGVIEGRREMRWESMQKLASLRGNTRLYCGHEYTQSNIRFAQTIEPDNTALIARAAEAAEQVAKHKPTIPTTMDAEKAANPFLRADLPDIAAAFRMAGKPPAQLFS